MTNNDSEFVASRGTFSFSDFVEKKATTPVVRTRIFIDNESAHERADLEDYITTLEAELKSLSAKDVLGGHTNSLATEDDTHRKIVETQARLQQAREAHKDATDRVLESCLVFVFRWSKWDEPRKVIDRAQTNWIANNAPELASKPNDEAVRSLLVSQQNEMAQYVSCALVAAGTVWVEDIHGSKDEVRRTVDEIVNFTENVILPTEKTKLFEGVSKAVGAGDDWFMGLDAGFPGRSPELA